MDVDHSLLAHPDYPDIIVPGTKVISNAQARAQSDKFIKKKGLVEDKTPYSTAGAAEHLSKLVGEGAQKYLAIAGVDNAERFGLKSLADKIQTKKDNKTKFVFVNKPEENIFENLYVFRGWRSALTIKVVSETGVDDHMLTADLWKPLRYIKENMRGRAYNLVTRPADPKKPLNSGNRRNYNKARATVLDNLATIADQGNVVNF